MKAMPYNPCADSFPAKAWECLRRNKSFLKVLDCIKSSTDEEQRHDEISYAQYEADKIGNDLADLVFSKHECWNTRFSWKQLAKAQRKKFEALFGKQTPLNISKPAPFSGAEYSPFAVELAPTDSDQLASIQEYHILIAVPKAVRHKQHHDQIVADIEKLVPQSSAKAIHLKPGGRRLGSKKDWDAFLLAERWRSQKFNPVEAQLLAAHELFGEDFGSTKEQRRKNAEPYFRRTGSNAKTPKHHSHFETGKMIKNIETSIESVFPSFDPYCPPTK